MRLDFTLVGRDQLSRVLDRAGDASNRLGRRLVTMSIDSDAAVRRFTNNASRNLAGLRRDNQAGAKAIGELGKATLMLAPAAIPAAASLAPIAAGAGAVAVALGVMGAALGPQISKLGEASDAQKKYEDAVAKSGASSKEAVTAQQEYLRLVGRMPEPTRRAAAAVALLKDDYEAWSDSLAGDTMAPFTKGVAVVNSLLPKTRDLVKGTSAEADRFMTIIGGEMASPGLDRLNSKFTTFAQSTLRKANDELVHLLRVSGSGQVGSNAREFMDWARAQGPTVAGVLSSVSTALVHVLEAGSDVGVGLLQVVEVLAKLVSAVPPGAIALFLQLALALKLTKAAALGLVAARTALAGFGASLVAMNTAAAAAPGRLAAVRAAVAALSRTTKVALAGTGIGLLVLALGELASMGQSASPDVDKLTSSLRQLGATGKATGEAAKAFGSDLDGLHDKVSALTDPSNAEKVQQFLVGWTSWDSTPVKDAKANLDSVDKALASLVSSGQSDLAAQALKRLTAEYGKGGRDTKAFTKELGDYQSALADAKFEQELAAASMGLFGAQAQKTQAALAAQKASADGLRQSLQALNDTQRAGLGGMIGFEAAVDAAAKAATENAGALDMAGGKLNLSGEKARAAATALQDLASKTDEAAASARESGSSWETVNGIYSRGRDALIKNAQAMGLSRDEAAQLADQILKIPNKTAKVDMATEDAKRDLEAFNAKVKKSPGSKSVTLTTLSKAAEQILESFGLKVKRLPNGKVTVSAKTGTALSGIRSIASAVAGLRSKSITITTNKVTKFSTQGTSSKVAPAHRDYAAGGLVVGFPGGGPVSGPGTSTSDSIPAMLSDGEFVINAKSTAKYRSLIEAINTGRLGGGVGMPGAGAAVAAGLASGMTGAAGSVDSAARMMAAAVVTGVKAELQIASPSKKTKALAQDVGKGFISGLTGSRDKIKSVSADLAKDIKTAFTGKKESSLLKMVDKQTKRLLDAASKRDKVAAKIAEAKAYAADVTKTARDQAGLSNLGMEPGEVSAGSIKGGLAQKLAQIKQFTKYIGVLAKRGLNKGLIRQILNMGPEAGYAYANALAGADKATFSQINKTQAAIDKETTKLGMSGADILYDSGKNAGKGFLKGLEGQKKSIENLMLDIAKGMQKSIKKALGIKSPSTVMAKLGAFSTEGLARGLVDGMPALDRSLAAVSGRVSGIQPVLGRAAVAGRGAGGTVIHIHVDGAVVDNLGFARAARQALLELKRAQGFADLGIA
jgi:chorismate mutase